mgnify:CR=1 FL=1
MWVFTMLCTGQCFRLCDFCFALHSYQKIKCFCRRHFKKIINTTPNFICSSLWDPFIPEKTMSQFFFNVKDSKVVGRQSSFIIKGTYLTTSCSKYCLKIKTHHLDIFISCFSVFSFFSLLSSISFKWFSYLFFNSVFFIILIS